MTTTDAPAAKGEAIPPCPWCSGSARLHECNDGHYVRCDVCDMSSGVFSRDDAIQAWSKRPAYTDAQLEAVARATYLAWWEPPDPNAWECLEAEQQEIWRLTIRAALKAMDGVVRT